MDCGCLRPCSNGRGILLNTIARSSAMRHAARAASRKMEARPRLMGLGAACPGVPTTSAAPPGCPRHLAWRQAVSRPHAGDTPLWREAARLLPTMVRDGRPRRQPLAPFPRDYALLCRGGQSATWSVAIRPTEWLTILDDGAQPGSSDLARPTTRQRVARAYPIAVRNETAGRAAEHAPLRFVPFPATRAGLGAVRLVLQLDAEAECLGLVRDLAALAAVRQGTYLLLALGLHAFAVGHVAHVADGQRAHSILDRAGDGFPADLVLDVAPAPVLPG